MLKTIVIVYIFIIFCMPALAQQTVVRGVIKDSKTGERIPFVNIFFEGTQKGVVSDMDGRYTIETSESYKRLVFSYLGYKPITNRIKEGKKQTINIFMKSNVKVLKEVVVASKKTKERYRNKDNPAVDVIRNVIANKDQNQLDYYNRVEYEEYEKLQLSLNNDINKLKKRKIYKKYRTIFDNADTTKAYGRSLLPIYLEEKISQNYIRKSPRRHKKIVTAHNSVKYDQYLDTDGVSDYLGRLYQNVNIYDNNISLLSNQFISPIADTSPIFYKFFITDTLKVDDEVLYEMTFVPRNSSDFLFQGTMYITLDERYAVQKLNMMVNRQINLNWVRDLHISQKFKKSGANRYYLSESTVAIDFTLSFSRKGTGIYGERTVSIKDFAVNVVRPDSLYEGKALEELEEAQKKENPHEDSFWKENRHIALTDAEYKTYSNIDSLQKIPSFKRAVNTISLLLSGYKDFGPFELGPVGTFMSFNPIEGFRMRVGGRTTSKLSNSVYGHGYVAYGFDDNRWKYSLGTTYSFTKKTPLEFPIRALSASYQKDTKIPGQELQLIPEDNVFLSLKRGINNKWTYNSIWKIGYHHELKNHLSFRVGLKRWNQEATGGIAFELERLVGSNVMLINQRRLTTFEASLELRWAPKEKFYQGKKYRISIRNKYPVFTARLVNGIKGALGGEYDYQHITLNITKTFYLSQLGFSDVILQGGYMLGRTPFPLLHIHRANQSYFYQHKSYNLMNFLEFVSDRYISLNIVHHFNGFFFNKIPFLKKLKLREIFTIKVLYGGIRTENMPTVDSGLYLFPRDVNGELETYSLGRSPYLELSFGIANILRFFRVDLVWRLTYLENPNVAPIGVRGKINFNF